MKYIQCRDCFKLVEQGVANCPRCERQMVDEAKFAPAIHVFRSGWFEHIALEPIYIKGKRQLKHETEDRGLTSHYVH